MGIDVKIIQSGDKSEWDSYVRIHPRANVYHLSGWQNVIKKTYGHRTYYLMAMKNHKQGNFSPKATLSIIPNSKAEFQRSESPEKCQEVTREQSTLNHKLSGKKVIGILPLVHLKHFIFGNRLVSLPFFDMGGMLASDERAEKALLLEAINLAKQLKIDEIELRHTKPLQFLTRNSRLQAHGTEEKTELSNDSTVSYELLPMSAIVQTHTHKVRMLLDLPDSSEELMKSFKSKLRSQIKKPTKEGLSSKIGGIELIDDFYEVFAINMRDLGSPVHSKKLVINVLEEFPKKAKIVMVYKQDQPVACSVIVGFKNTLENPWASSLRDYSRLSPNMLLYWSMLEYACDNGYVHFDFGRSTPNEGTYKFKKQWGAEPKILYWYIALPNSVTLEDRNPENTKFDQAILFWKKLPVFLTKIIGPRIRKHISL